MESQKKYIMKVHLPHRSSKNSSRSATYSSSRMPPKSTGLNDEAPTVQQPSWFHTVPAATSGGYAPATANQTLWTDDGYLQDRQQRSTQSALSPMDTSSNSSTDCNVDRGVPVTSCYSASPVFSSTAKAPYDYYRSGYLHQPSHHSSEGFTNHDNFGNFFSSLNLRM